MNSSFSYRPRKKCLVPLALTWSHSGVAYRVTPWPEVRFERLYGDDWIETEPTEDVFASAGNVCGPLEWKPYLEFVPANVREFLAQFTYTKMEALRVVARCPELLTPLAETPALTSFVAGHVGLRGTRQPCWGEINAVYERNGVFGLLEWLGLAASRQTLAILHNVVQAEIPKRLLEPLRAMLWEPHAIFVLQRLPAITDQTLTRTAHALAA